MKFYTANYSTTNHNFVIQNLEGERVDNKYLPAILILKNILQRGKPTLMSKFLQSKIGSIHEKEDFNTPYTLIDKELPIWHHTIKGDDTNNYYPAKTFFEQKLQNELTEYKFVTQLIRPETPINEITQKNDERFKHQQVDFYLPQAFLVIEIDGQQHKKDDIYRLSDKERDEHLALHRVKTIRINTFDLEKNTTVFKERIEEINNRVSEYAKILDFYKRSLERDINSLPERILNQKLLPTAIIRFQILILELLESGKLKLDDKSWIIELKENDIKGFADLAIQDLFIWLNHLLKLQKIDFKEPDYQIKQFSKEKNIKIDFSLLKRWTDENELYNDIIYCRTDYFDIYFDRVTKQTERISNFHLSATNPVEYKLIRDGENNDLQHLVFFLENIFGYNSFNPGQYPIIENALARRDTIGLLPTGGGKSLTYQLACLLQPSISFVVCPIKSLMFDQKKDLEDAYFQNIETITSEVTGEAREQILDNFGNGKYFFVFISPERFQTQDFRDRLSAINVNYSFAYAVIDEVHCLSEWGHDFRTSYLNLSKTIRKYCGSFNFLGLTATASVNVLKDIQIEFNIKQEDVKTLIDYTRPELEFIVIKDKGNKEGFLKQILTEKQEKEDIFQIHGEVTRCGLIFTPYVNGKYGCYPLANKLKTDLEIEVKSYSGTRPNDFPAHIDFDKYKITVQNDFKSNKFCLLTATKAFGMGINKRNIDYTFHYGIPSSMEALYQEAGRAGRNRQSSECYVLLSEEDENIEQLFSQNATYEEIKSITENIGWGGKDVIRQIFLYQQGLEPIDKELELIKDLHYKFSKPNSKKVVNGNVLGTSKARVERAIYRLSNIGIIKDWTIENFFGGGIFTVYYNDFTEKSIKKGLMNFITKYKDDDVESIKYKYSEIYNRIDLNVFEKVALILLKWSYDKFAFNRRQSLENLYNKCVSYENTVKGKQKFKEELEAYFKFTQATYILQHIAENNDKDFEKWFEIFYDKNNDFINRDKLIELEGNLLRFLESYQNNTGLNLINALVILFLDKSLIKSHSERFENALQTISNYNERDYDYIIDQILNISKQFSEQNKMKIVNFLYKISKSEEEFLFIAKELGDISVLLEHYNTKLKIITKRFENGLRKVG
ncbi:MAG: RecQ family ATP-dependent DNA helicase [Bacteroidales bacterium]|nr:RecQ family ATP-dependent DNA helicase [Bacteroidales bacterium]